MYGHNSRFRLLGNTKDEQERYLYLINKFFDGKTLWERTKIDNNSGLVGLCMGECSIFIHGDYFCRASFGNDISCPYAGERVDGGNPFQKCGYFEELLKNIKGEKCVDPEYFRNIRRV